MKREDELIGRYLDGQASEAEVAELDSLLVESAMVRQTFLDQANAIAALEEEFALELKSERAPISSMPKRKASRILVLTWASVAVVLLGLLGSILTSPGPVAILVSNEDAAWESCLPTTPGSELPPGHMALKSGVATIQFRSGVTVTLEAPSEIELISHMRSKLVSGTAVVEVPESGNGFVMETPDGYAIDHGTAFAVSTGNRERGSRFEVLEGEISLHASGDRDVFLEANQAASIAEGRVTVKEGPVTEGTLETPRDIHRIMTEGRTVSIVRCNEFDKLHPDFLMVKRDLGDRKYERRAFLQFDTGGIDWGKVKNVQLRFNLVPCGLGYAANLDTMNQFVVYGVQGNLAIDPAKPARWKDMPDISEATRVGSFDIARSQQRGTFEISGGQLIDFIRSNPNQQTTFLLTRETEELKTRGLVHAFASDSHPEASGPTLELSY